VFRGGGGEMERFINGSFALVSGFLFAVYSMGSI